MSRLLQWTRLALIALTIGLLGVVAAGIVLLPDYAGRHALEFTPNAFWTAAETQAALAELKWPATSLAWYTSSIDVAVTLAGIGLALFLLWRKSDDWFGLYLSFAFLVVSPGSRLLEAVVERVPALSGPNEVLGAVGWQLTFVIFYLFPDGRFVPRWTRWMPLAWLGVNLPQWLLGSDLLTSPALAMGIGMGLVLTVVGSQVYRYARHASALERQQTKWVVAVLAATFVFGLIAGPAVYRPPPAEALGRTLPWVLLLGAILKTSSLALPAAITIAILRYRLWDIDVIIRRTLTYSVLSAILAGAYLGSVLVLQGVFQALTGQGQNSLVTVLSTLGIAALFGPVRQRVQGAIDRRFYRKKYDAARTLAGFGASVRDDVDLEGLQAQLLGVVEETMQPATMSLWLAKRQ
jgi:hypothetical protein